MADFKSPLNGTSTTVLVDFCATASSVESKRRGNEDNVKRLDVERLDDNCFGDFYVKHGKLRKTHGINWLVAALFIVADMAGAGIVALPNTVIKSGFYPGICLIFIMAFLGTASAVVLGKAWVIMLRLFPRYRTHCRKPYSEMGYRACGRSMRILVSGCLNITQFGIATTFLLLIARSGSDILSTLNIRHVDYCYMILVVALMLIPEILLKSPKDFWQIVALGMASTMIACLFISIGAAIDFRGCRLNEMPSIRVSAILSTMGVVLFTFGGHSALPTVQHDMRKPNDFTKSSILAFIIILTMNLIVVVFGAVSYGNSVNDTVITSIQTSFIKIFVNFMIVCHCLMTFPLMINPLNQEIEEYLNISQGFCIKRVVVRLTLLLGVTFTALSVPSFGEVMSLLGASTLTATSMVFPPIFYLFLAAAEHKRRAGSEGGVLGTMMSGTVMAAHITLSSLSVDGILSPKSDEPLRKENNIGGGGDAVAPVPPLESKIALSDANYENNDAEYLVGVREVISSTDAKMLALCTAMIVIGTVAGTAGTFYSLQSIIKEKVAVTPCYFNYLFGGNDDNVSGGTAVANAT